MAQKYYSTQEAAQVLGVTTDQVKEMHQRREVYGYRDGTDWKFKVEEIDKLAADLRSRPAPAAEDESDVLLSEVELGQSDASSSGTVIGMEGGHKAAANSDLELSEDAAAVGKQDQVDSKVTEFEELDLTLEEDLTLDKDQTAAAAEATGGSDVDLTGKDLDDDDLVLGGSGTGSDVTIGGDSGISLVDPADSGLSLEEPLDLAGSGAESLELGEDDMVALADDVETEAPTELKTDDDFLLTPLEEADEEGSESGSQVIALDTEGDETATMVAGGGMAAMLDEDLSTQPAGDLGVAGLEGVAAGIAPLGVHPGGLAEGAPLTQPAAALPETPYSALNILSLALCVFVLILCGMFMFDLLRNMWSWNAPYNVNSSMMDWVLSLFEG